MASLTALVAASARNRKGISWSFAPALRSNATHYGGTCFRYLIKAHLRPDTRLIPCKGGQRSYSQSNLSLTEFLRCV